MRGISAVTSEMLWVLKNTYDVSLDWFFSPTDDGEMFLANGSVDPVSRAEPTRVNPRAELLYALEAMQRAIKSLDEASEDGTDEDNDQPR